jgi:hypothetical protein
MEIIGKISVFHKINKFQTIVKPELSPGGYARRFHAKSAQHI